MSLENIIATLDAEIARLQQARALLIGIQSRTATTAEITPKRKRRKLSTAARKRMAEAQRKRWAAQKAKAA